MTSRDNARWRQCWRDRNTGFHQKAVNSLLQRFWPGLGLGQGSRVFVPLCGKSRDMLWLAQQGHEVIGAELSPVAVGAFFRENRFKPSRQRAGQFTRWKHEKLEILCGDFFSLTQADLGPIDAIYDRAALTALPAELRGVYIAHLRVLVPESCKVFLLTIEEPEDGEFEDQEFAMADEIKALFEGAVEIDLAHVESIYETAAEDPNRSPERADHKVYRITLPRVWTSSP